MTEKVFKWQHPIWQITLRLNQLCNLPFDTKHVFSRYDRAFKLIQSNFDQERVLAALSEPVNIDRIKLTFPDDPVYQNTHPNLSVRFYPALAFRFDHEPLPKILSMVPTGSEGEFITVR
ncbi:hypothetical protein ABKN59_005695 [Abortiporus biennis]